MEKICLYDIAPTILHAMDAPVPTDMDGRVVLELFREGSPLAGKAIAYKESEKEKMAQRVRALKRGGKL